MVLVLYFYHRTEIVIRMIMKVKTILVSQPEPSSEKSPYIRLQEKLKLTVHFRPFIHVEGVDAKEVRQQKIDFNTCGVLNVNALLEPFLVTIFCNVLISCSMNICYFYGI